MPDCHDETQQQIVKSARAHLAAYNDMEEMIRLGAYRRGTNPEVDKAIQLNPGLEAFLSQHKRDQTSLEDGFAQLQELVTK
jgi:flagellum-specific ATP synthase